MRFGQQLLAAGVLGAALGAVAVAEAGKAGEEWTALFNGKDLSGWDTWLGKPHGGTEPVGLNKDPKQVYTVVEEDGRPAIRISGEIFGALTSKEEFGDYHLRLDFKWGEKRWPPREHAVRDSGLLYHCVGRHGAGDGYWMQSLEFQIEEHDCGDFWSVAGVLVDVEADYIAGSRTLPVIYKKGGKKFRIPSAEIEDTGPRIVKAADWEKPHGQWNRLELLAVGSTSVHVVNGRVVLVLTNARRRVNGREEPLARGKIQLQSEGAEVFYRDILIKPLKQIPSGRMKDEG